MDSLLAGLLVVALLAVTGCVAQTWPPDPPLAEPEYVPQSIGVMPPVALEMWLASPKHHGYPWNIVRIWFPEAVTASGADGGKLWDWRMAAGRNEWQKDTDSWFSHESLVDGATMTRRARPHGDQMDFALTFENKGTTAWSQIVPASCLQLSAAADYEDNTGERTYLVIDGEPTPTAALAITDAGMRGAGTVGDDVPLKDGRRGRVTEGALFVVSRDGRYVLGYAWEPASRFFYNRAGIVACIHIHPAVGPVDPGTSVTVDGVLFVHEGGPSGAVERYREWVSRASQ